MSSKKTKLELTWIGKEHRPKLEPRILLEEPDKSHHAKFRVREWPQENTENSKNSDSLRSLRSFAATHEVGDIFDNMLIREDNLLGLKALEQEFAGKANQKLASQKQIRLIENQCNEKRSSLFEAQDAIDLQREALINKIEGKLQHSVAALSLFSICWTMS